ncbi:MAG: tRNA dimethylallyltransferase [Woeseiaceae bacterium]|nr:tRNA dimethylallyltransferase [Woeseiaceae bacterium]
MLFRSAIEAEGARDGGPALHAELARVDPAAAGRIEPTDSQRIQRALEVYRASGRPLSAWQDAGTAPVGGVRYLRIGLVPADRRALHERIEQRLNSMLNNGFLEEVEALSKRPGLQRNAPSMRAVGYRQLWSYVAGEQDLDAARYRALVATRQLAKRQLTWLRSEAEIFSLDPLESDPLGAISTFLATRLR